MFSHSAWTNPWSHVETNVWYIHLFNFKMVFVNILLGYKCYWSCTKLPLFLISKKVSCTNWWSPKPNDAISKNYGKKIVISFHKIQLRCQFNFDLLIWSPFDSFRLFFLFGIDDNSCVNFWYGSPIYRVDFHCEVMKGFWSLKNGYEHGNQENPFTITVKVDPRWILDLLVYWELFVWQMTLFNTFSICHSPVDLFSEVNVSICNRIVVNNDVVHF